MGAHLAVLEVSVQRLTPRPHKNQRRPAAQRSVSDARAVDAGAEPDLEFHHSPSRTAHNRTSSPTPFSACSPRSSKRTPADVRASERTVSDTSTSPGAESPLMREAMLTAPP